MNPDAIEWCSFKKGASVLYTMVVDLLEDSAPELMHKCPYFGRIEVYNMTINVNKFLSVFSQGDYKAIVSYSVGKTDFLRFIFGVNVKSGIKSSFG